MQKNLYAALLVFAAVAFFIISTLRPISDAIAQDSDFMPAVGQTVLRLNSESIPVLLGDLSAQSPVCYTPLNYDKVKAMWFAYFDYRDILQSRSAEEFENEITERFSNAKSLGVNTLYVHVRSNGDAYYDSNIFPWASRCAGTLGVSPGFDPLEIMLKCAHELELSFHAWINPLRLMTNEEMQDLPSDYIIKQWYNDPEKNGRFLVNVDNIWYLNPAYKEVQLLVFNGVYEIIANYNVDGIHIDDYFYPTVDPSFDESAFSQSNAENLGQWRYSNTNSLVKGIYNTVKSYNNELLFGISPAALISANQSIFADVGAWCSQDGFCDYIVPQIYFGFTNESNPFENIIEQWEQMISLGNVKLIIGICTYKYSENTEGEWTDPTVTQRQIERAFDSQYAQGAAIYSYASTFCPTANIEICDSVRSGIQSAFSQY